METEPSYTDDVRGAEVPARGGGGGDAGDHAGGAAVCGVGGCLKETRSWTAIELRKD